MNLVRRILSKAGPQQQSLTARWLQPSENVWRLSILDCTQFADGMTSFTSDQQIAESFNRLRTESGQELSNANLTPRQSLRCNLAYEINKQPPDGPVFKSRVMEEKWDIYLYDSKPTFAAVGPVNWSIVPLLNLNRRGCESRRFKVSRTCRTISLCARWTSLSKVTCCWLWHSIHCF
jgi:hypothetical protein